MGSLEMTCLDSECSCGCCSSKVTNDDTHEIICFWEVDEGSYYSMSSSTTDSSNHGHNFDSEIGNGLHSGRVSSVVGSDCRVDIGNGVDEVQIYFRTTERDCRICQSSLDLESGTVIELGCSCKNELAAIHQHCAETWFRIKGNKICEICNSIAQNIVGTNIIESRQQISAVNTFSTGEVSVPILEVTHYPEPLSPASHNGDCFVLIILILIICFVIFILILKGV